jgi:uncharacterized protein
VVRERTLQLVGLTLLAAALALGLFWVAGGIRDRGSTDAVTVTGSAKQRIESDYVVWIASVTSQQARPGAALDQLDGWTEQVRAFLLRSGTQEEELTVLPVFTEEVYGQTAEGQQTGEVVGYRLTRSFEVRSSRIDETRALIEASTGLLSEGIPLSAQPPQYVYTDLAKLRPRLLAAATRDAQTRARMIVESTGRELGDLRSVSVGVFQVTAPNSTEVSDYGVYDTATVRKDVTAVVNVAFALE